MSEQYDGHHEAVHGHVRKREEVHGLRHCNDEGPESGKRLLSLHKILRIEALLR